VGSQVRGLVQAAAAVEQPAGTGAARPLPGRLVKAWAALSPSCPHVLQLSERLLFRQPHISYLWYQQMFAILP